MPGTAAELIEKIRNEIAFTAIEWKTFETLFDDANTEVLQRAAPGFFMVVNMALQRDVFLALARLTDPARMGPHENISLRALIEALPSHLDQKAVADLRARLETLERDAGSIRLYRMKVGAHNDLQHGLGRQAPPTTARQAVQRVLEDASRILEDAAQLVSPGSIPRPLESSIRGGARRLLALVGRAIATDSEDPTWE